MHVANHNFWAYCKATYPQSFIGVRAIEFGSLFINGTVRDYFESTIAYVGIDWMLGGCVDIRCYAHDAPFKDEVFDTVVSASMLEHDPFWRCSLSTMCRVLKPNGLMFLSWGSARNGAHEHCVAPDGKFHALPTINVFDVLQGHGMTVIRSSYEVSFGGTDREAVLIAVKGAWSGAVQLDPLFLEDQVRLP